MFIAVFQDEMRFEVTSIPKLLASLNVCHFPNWIAILYLLALISLNLINFLKKLKSKNLDSSSTESFIHYAFVRESMTNVSLTGKIEKVSDNYY